MSTQQTTNSETSQISDLVTSSEMCYLMRNEEIPQEIIGMDFFWRPNEEIVQNISQHQVEADGISDSQIAVFADKEERWETMKSDLPSYVLEELERPFSTGKRCYASRLRHN